MVAALDGSGLGVVIDEDHVREASTAKAAWRNPVWRSPDGAVREWQSPLNPRTAASRCPPRPVPR